MLKLGTLVSAKNLAECITKFPNNLRVLDASWFLPTSEIKAHENYKNGHIPGALYFDIDDCMTSSPYEHMLPSVSQFEEYVGNLGIDNNTHVVVYNDHPQFAIFSAPRVWWTFRVFGHNSVSVLNGGFRAWKDAKFDTATGVEEVAKKSFKAKYNPKLVKTMEDVIKNFETKEFQFIDARSAGRFFGREPEPRPDVKPGHIPGAVSVPFMSVQTSATFEGKEYDRGIVKNKEELQKVFEENQVDLTKPITATCGTGVTACNLALAAFLCGKEDVAVYDGSWVEWFNRSSPSQRVDCPEN